MRSRIAALVALAVVAGLLPFAGRSFAQVPDPTVPAARETEPVVLTGTSFPEWATLGDVALEAPSLDGARCQATKEGAPENPVTSSEKCTHNQYEDPDFQTSDYLKNEGVPVGRLAGYRWNGERFEQIPFQVDEMFTRYISNNNSGFSFYSETDQHHSYAFDREGFRWTESDPENPCLARPASEPAGDPVPGLDTDDEVVFMARDAAGRAPSTAGLPGGIEDSYEIAIADPSNHGATSYVYVMKTAPDGPSPAFDASNGYVRYEREPEADVFLYSQSRYSGYGAAPKGPWYDPATGVCHTDPADYKQRRPGDQAWVTTPRYRFHYDGRWVMDELHVSANADGTYGPDLIDQWKARAFQQRPGGSTPCCGYEEEVNNWGGSSILMGELAGPVRTIRETWGADSGTNVVRREIFYRDEIRFISFLRVHVIPPGDGIYAQWDYNAGMVSTYYNQFNPDGVAIDGKNDEEYGNTHVHAAHDGVSFDPDGDGPQDPIVIGNPGDGCPPEPHDRWPDCVHNDVDFPDPFFSGPNSGLSYEQVTGPHGTLVWRTSLKQVTPGGAAQSVFSVPYYRDDSCFDDGTGSNPGPHLNPAKPDDGEYSMYNGEPRKCWDSATDPVPPPEGDPRYYQGAIGTHGIHILLIADSDNAGTTAPVTEIDGEQRLVVLPPTPGNVGEKYGRGVEKPLVVTAAPESRARGNDPAPSPTETSPSPTPTSTESPAPEKSPTSVEFTAESDSGGQYSDRATVQARLTDETGGGIAGEDIAFEMSGGDGTSTVTATTDDSGTATTTITLDGTPGSYQLIARYDGDDSKLGSADQMSFAIDREDTQLALDVSGKNSKRQLVATLTDHDSGGGIVDRTIEFFEGGKSIGSATTNSDGIATIDARAGNRDFEARFDGDDYYLASSAQQRG
ncbi:MAG: Ig-like domain-containing protein [Actinobacteria bacterium]|nr:Ig-like domain-containing protein [Actinomycetota bacterium]